MRNKNYFQDLSDIQSMADKIKNPNRLLNENINFKDEYDDNYDLDDEIPQGEEEMPEEECANGECEMSKADTEDEGMAELDKMGAIDQIREITLKGMTQLCKQPEHPEFQALLKIFQLCNKAVEPKDENKEEKKF